MTADGYKPLVVIEEPTEDKPLIRYLDTKEQIEQYAEELPVEQKADEVRAVRNQYLKQYVDPKQLVLVWNGLTEDEQKEYMDYRKYLLDYPETEGWYEQPPKDFSTWKEMLIEEE